MVLEGSLHDVPVAVNLSGIVDGLSVRIPGDHPLLVRSVGDSLGATVVDPDNEEFAAVDQGDFLACRAYGHLGCVLDVDILDLLIASIVGHIDIQFFGLLAVLYGVDVTLPYKGDGAVLCDADLPYREILEICQLSLGPRCKVLLEEVQGVVSCKIELTFEPQWDKSMLSEEARVQLGMDDMDDDYGSLND